MDAAGNFNNIAFGKDYRRPRMRLPGSGGIPDVTPQYDHAYLYVPRHSRLTFAKKVDFVSGLGHAPQRRTGGGPRYLISDLGEFDWREGCMRLTSVHAHTDLADDQAQDRLCAGDRGRCSRNFPARTRRLAAACVMRSTRWAFANWRPWGGAARKNLLREILREEGAL